LSASTQSWTSFSLEADVMSLGLDLLVWVAVGAIGGFLVVISAVAVGNALRRRQREAALVRGAKSAPPRTRAVPRVDTDTRATSDAGESGVGATSSSQMLPGKLVIGYVTVSGRPGEDDASASAIADWCARSGCELLEVMRDADEGPSLERPGLRSALQDIVAREATGLVINDLECLSHSIIDLGALMAWFRDGGATLIVLDLDIDTSTPEGSHVANTLIALSVREHERIAAGTRRGLARGRASGHPTGRPAVSHQPELVARIAAMRAGNMTLSAIADRLNAEGVPTLRGGKKWRPSSIQAALGYRRPGRRDRLPGPHA
jgi:DNA invertase Pin-like site-specific DNA recombinase